MRVLHGDPGSWDAGGPHAVTIGVFDGVHRGHRHLIGRVREGADRKGIEAGLVTFDRHPLTVLAPDHAPPVLTPLDRRLELFEGAGLDTVGVLPFGPDVRDLSPREFVRVALSGGMGARLVVTGEDFRFGKDRAGDVSILADLGPVMGFTFESIPLIEGNGPLSSTHIRQLVAEGQTAAAAAALGRPFELRGSVVSGPGRGGRIGIPTATVEISSGRAVPKRGVYAVYTEIEGMGRTPGVANIGVRPTFGGIREVVEVHVIGFEADLYGRWISLEFFRRLRDERRFEDPGDLVAQIHKDIEEAIVLFAGRAP